MGAAHPRSDRIHGARAWAVARTLEAHRHLTCSRDLEPERAASDLICHPMHFVGRCRHESSPVLALARRLNHDLCDMADEEIGLVEARTPDVQRALEAIRRFFGG